MEQRLAADIQLARRAAAVRLLVLDVDGVLTDGRITYGASGEELKSFHVRDGLGLRLLREAGVRLAILSGRRSPAVERRARELGIDPCLQAVEDKGAALDALLELLEVPASAVACIGDDLPDLPLMFRCGLAVTVPEAPAPLRQRAHFVTSAPGGGGAVRELCELVLTAQGRWQALLAGYAR